MSIVVEDMYTPGFTFEFSASWIYRRIRNMDRTIVLYSKITSPRNIHSKFVAKRFMRLNNAARRVSITNTSKRPACYVEQIEPTRTIHISFWSLSWQEFGVNLEDTSSLIETSKIATMLMLPLKWKRTKQRYVRCCLWQIYNLIVPPHAPRLDWSCHGSFRQDIEPLTASRQ
jgi:hypothetical protein